MEDEIREESGVEGYIENIKTNGVSLCLDDKAAIIRSSLKNPEYNFELDWELTKYIDRHEEDGNVKFHDREFDQNSQMEAVDVIRKDFLKSHLPDLMCSKHEWAFDNDGSMYEKLTDKQALEIAYDYPLSAFLMDESNYQAVMSDREVVKALIIGHDVSLKFASDDLKSNKEFVLQAVMGDGWALHYASEDLRANKEVVMKALQNSGRVLECVSDKLKSDKNIVLEAVKQDGYSLNYANETLQADKDVVLAAVAKNANALHFASDDIKKLVGDGDPVHIITKAINAEKLSAKLNNDLKPKPENQQPKMKI